MCVCHVEFNKLTYLLTYLIVLHLVSKNSTEVKLFIAWLLIFCRLVYYANMISVLGLQLINNSIKLNCFEKLTGQYCVGEMGSEDIVGYKKLRITVMHSLPINGMFKEAKRGYAMDPLRKP